MDHLFIIPDGDRRWARREYLKDAYRHSTEGFKKALKGLPLATFAAIEDRIKEYSASGIDPFYSNSGNTDVLDSKHLSVPEKYLLDSYRKGGQVFDQLIRWILKVQIAQVLSIYALQRRNLDRKDDEVFPILTAETETFQKWADDNVICSQCSFKFVGDLSLFQPHSKRSHLTKIIDEFLEVATELELRSKGNKLKIYILAPYDRLLEMNQAVSNGRFDPSKLVVKEEVDLIMRAGNAQTPTSGALPYQVAYAQFSTVKEYFPDWTKKTVQKVLENYGAKERESGL